jgi:pyruvate formate lyase activating enzyme
MLQVELLTALCERLSKSVGSVLLDSNGSIDFSAHPQLMGSCNGVMLDIKILDETRHKEITGQSNAMVIKNALYLIRHNKLAEVRTVVVPDVLPNEDTVIRTAELLARSITNGKRIPYRLIRFRPNGTKGEANSYRTPKMEYMQYLEQCLEAYGCFKPIVV